MVDGGAGATDADGHDSGIDDEHGDAESWEEAAKEEYKQTPETPGVEAETGEMHDDVTKVCDIFIGGSAKGATSNVVMQTARVANRCATPSGSHADVAAAVVTRWRQTIDNVETRDVALKCEKVSACATGRATTATQHGKTRTTMVMREMTAAMIRTSGRSTSSTRPARRSSPTACSVPGTPCPPDSRSFRAWPRCARRKS